MYRLRKIRIYPNSNQKRILNINFGGVRFARNKYIEYINNHRFIGYKEYSKILNQLKKYDPDYIWLVDDKVSTKAIKDALHNEDKRWCQYFKACTDYKMGKLEEPPKRPTFISKKYQKRQSIFIIKDTIHYDGYGRRCISLPIIGRIRISEHIEHLPPNNLVTSGYITLEGNKYYLSLRYKPGIINATKSNVSMGIDLGIKSYATIAYKTNDEICTISVDHFIFTDKYKTISEKIKELNRIKSHKAEINYGRLLNQWLDRHPNEDLSKKYKNKLKGESYNTSSIKRLQYKINKLEDKLVNIRKDFIDKLANRLVVITKQQITVPQYITIEGLRISDMLRNTPYMNNNHRLHDFISDSGWYMFAQVLKHLCELFTCELRVADTFYPSSKTCSRCGHIKRDLKLYERVYKCKKCGFEIDRDDNAAINLVNLDVYQLA